MTALFKSSELVLIENTPWSSKKNLAEAYNNFMDRLKPGEWALFRDSDTMFSTPDYQLIIEECILKNPDASAFTGVTNRIGCKWQLAPGIDVTSNDMEYHRTKGFDYKSEFGSECKDMTKRSPWSGFLMVISKDIWDKFGGLDGNAMETIDNQIHKKIREAGGKIMQMKGVYMYHWYSNYWPEKPGKRDKSHLKK